MIADLVRTNANLAIVVLSMLVSFYQPIGPDLVIILKGMSGGETYSSASLAIGFTMLGAALGYLLARVWGRRIMLRLFSRRLRAIEKAEKAYEKYGSWFLFLSAIGPIPLTYAVWISGLLKMSTRKFFILTLAGLVPRFWVEAIIARYCPSALQVILERFKLAI